MRHYNEEDNFSAIIHSPTALYTVLDFKTVKYIILYGMGYLTIYNSNIHNGKRDIWHKSKTSLN